MKAAWLQAFEQGGRPPNRGPKFKDFMGTKRCTKVNRIYLDSGGITFSDGRGRPQRGDTIPTYPQKPTTLE
jgi:hypothetical protein